MPAYLVSPSVPATPRKPDVRSFVAVGAIEAVVRGIVLSVYPLLMYRAWGEAAVVSKWYFLVGVVSLLTGLSVPLLTRHVSRRWAYSMGVGLYLLSAGFGMAGGTWTTLALLCHVTGTATVFVCFNAYVLDNIDKTDFGRLESRRLMFGAIGWTIGPVLGVWLLRFWHGAPFVIVGLSALTMLAAFWGLGLSSGRVSTRPRGTSANPFGFLQRFAAQPRLVAGWLFAVLRSCGWSVYTVYVGIFAVQNGLGDQVGGIASSLANMGLFMAPLMLRWMHRGSVRHAVRTGFLMGGLHLRAGRAVLAVSDGGRGDSAGGVFFSGAAGCLRRPAIPDVGQAVAAHRDVGGVFECWPARSDVLRGPRCAQPVVCFST
jgi:ACDE family multidrug resistance protein